MPLLDVVMFYAQCFLALGFTIWLKQLCVVQFFLNMTHMRGQQSFPLTKFTNTCFFIFCVRLSLAPIHYILNIYAQSVHVTIAYLFMLALGILCSFQTGFGMPAIIRNTSATNASTSTISTNRGACT